MERMVSYGMGSRCGFLLLSLGLVVIAGCNAVAADQVALSAQSDAKLQSSSAEPLRGGMASEHRAVQSRATLVGEGLIRDNTGVVSSSPCAQHEELLLDPVVPPVCDELEIASLGTSYHAYLFSKSHDVLVIYHEGHHECGQSRALGDTILPDAKDLMVRLLERADVLYLDMPLLAINCGQKIDINGIKYTGASHNWFAILDRPGESALAFFFNHIHQALDFLGPKYRTIHMTGRSGGGWATTVYAAVDWRITRSVSVAGSLPIEFRTPDLDGIDDIGDWEQYGPHVLRLLSYEALYEAAGGVAEPRRHIQIYNEFDNCCFSGVKGLAAADAYSASKAEYMQGRVKFLVNRGEWSHVIPVEMVIEQLFGP
jgi:hypothetical protein